ncbi:hypothetical protein HYPBUDRAFT_163347 [Hyphopichia burtonii NRRL Y-1933]|uniref:Phosphatidylinositol 4-kinase n=1 Tax=Hyphopichia burtonii NRRL Y-1933 TaxID=984485 RepID=A0A1E4RCT6_9ASCO|nr:hypothetical protein HYPBUDRAFT_163347 [Hyphopichia burtonii NRRL Y-1933]ODV65046.1 hypothetical protein HYPBUDRAFT_163347 [Hyphopichia burtonii NRRL Y-1933]
MSSEGDRSPDKKDRGFHKVQSSEPMPKCPLQFDYDDASLITPRRLESFEEELSPKNSNLANYTSTTSEFNRNSSLTSNHSNSSVDSVTDIDVTNLKLPSQGNNKTSLSAPVTPLPLARCKPQSSLGNNINKFTKNYIIPAAKWAYSPIAKKEPTESKFSRNDDYSIEYSVFKPIRGLPTIKNAHDLFNHWKVILNNEHDSLDHTLVKHLTLNYPDNHISPQDFDNLIESIIHSIEIDDISPQRISQGSSGSYFIRNKKIIEFNLEYIYKAGIFKPKDEEPYGPLSPKWTKWLHRTFFPCFFGRSCLIPNLGYVSETAASVLDESLLSYIVPHTDIVFFKSSAFYYSYWDRHSKSLPAKVGSFQLFLDGYIDAQSWFKNNPVPTDISHLPDKYEVKLRHDEDIKDDYEFHWSKRSLQQFQEELEKLVILDYIMRNTDRGLDNWMIKVDWKKIIVETKKNKHNYIKLVPVIKIGAIDSGLAFPWKHPDEWRSFPFGWLFLPLSIIGQPFSHKTRNHYLPLLTSKYWWETTVVKLKNVFKKDSDFKSRMWLKQLAVLKGQAFNVVEILKLGYAGPLELTRRENLLIWDDEMNVPVHVDNHVLINAMESSIYDLGLQPRYGAFSDERYEQTPLVNSSGGGGEETNTKKVIIERLEKVNAKPPVFTWC